MQFQVIIVLCPLSKACFLKILDYELQLSRDTAMFSSEKKYVSATQSSTLSTSSSWHTQVLSALKFVLSDWMNLSQSTLDNRLLLRSPCSKALFRHEVHICMYFYSANQKHWSFYLLFKFKIYTGNVPECVFVIRTALLLLIAVVFICFGVWWEKKIKSPSILWRGKSNGGIRYVGVYLYWGFTCRIIRVVVWSLRHRLRAHIIGG